MFRLIRLLRAISIHALLAESDHYDNYNLHCVEISIHALLAESDRPDTNRPCKPCNFYPRSPCGERLNKRCEFSRDNGFLSTLSLRRATRQTPLIRFFRGIFLSTLSLRRATCSHVGAWLYKNISIHALLAESD